MCSTAVRRIDKATTSAAVLLGAPYYEVLVDELELLRNIRTAELQIDGAGPAIDRGDAPVREALDLPAGSYR